MRSATEYSIATRQAERALKAGNCAPTFRLRDQRGVEVASEMLLRHGLLLLTFYTGSWRPACSRDLQAFESLRPSVEARGASLVSTSPQTVAENAKARAQLKLGFPILSDRGGRLAQLYWCIPELLRDIHRAASTCRSSTATRVGRCRSWPASSSIGRDHRLLRDQPRPVRPLPAARRLACAGPPAQPAGRLNREQQNAGVPRPASRLPTCRPSALPQSARTSALLRRWKRPRPQPGTTAPERRRDD